MPQNRFETTTFYLEYTQFQILALKKQQRQQGIVFVQLFSFLQNKIDHLVLSQNKLT